MGDTLKNTFLLVTEKEWHDDLFNHLSHKIEGDWHRIKNKADFTIEHVAQLNPSIIFIPHWSYIIPPSIYEQYECVVLHMTDLPFGRGGSPLQNLIVRGVKETKISALKVTEGLDTGDIYLKMPFSLAGTAQEIFIRSSDVVKEMIIEIIEQDLKSVPQEGEVTSFRRRKPEEGSISSLNELEKVYDYIRMLDCDGYPNAFIETEHLRFEFSNAILENDKMVTANVRIIKK